MLKRIFDISFSLFLCLLFLCPSIIIGLLIKTTSDGPILFWSQRVGQYNKLFWMPKFRTMAHTTPIIATNHLNNPHEYVSPVGSFLRRFSLDEIPQLWCILTGHMSIVGPRPLLSDASEKKLLDLRTINKIPSLKPGLTGWAQINGRDFLTEDQKINHDVFYLRHNSFILDMKIVVITIFKVLFSFDVRH